MPSLKNVWVIIPAFNEERKITEVIADLKEKGFTQIVVVDDGSRDKTGELAKDQGAVVLRHLVNRGLGAALGTGFSFCCAKKARVVLTIDGDGQHLASDALKVTLPVISGAVDVALGVRKKDIKTFPIERFFINLAANILTFSLFGIWVSDSQSGLRAISAKALESMHLRSDGMAISSEIVGEIKKCGLTLGEVPIQSIYTRYSLSKGQTRANSFRVARKLILKRLGV